MTQTEEDFLACNLDTGVYYGDRKEVGRYNTIATWQSLNVLEKKAKNEQASAGLDNLTSEEYEQFAELNRSYREKYGFPFIIAVKNYSKSEILDNFISRIKNTEEMEFNEACAQVEQIAEIRLLDII